MIQDRSGEYLAAGMRSASDSFSQTLQQMGKQMEKRREEEKNRAREFKALQEYADVTGIAPKDKTTPMGLDSLRGMIEGHVFKQREQERAVQSQLQIAQLQRHLKDQTDSENRQMALQKFYAGASGAGFPGGEDVAGPPQAMNPEMLLQLAGQTGVDPRDFELVTRGIENVRRLGAPAKELPDIPPGMQLKRVTAGGATYELPDADKPASQGRLKPVIVDGQPVPGLFFDEDTKQYVKQTTDPVAALLGVMGAGAAPAKAADPKAKATEVIRYTKEGRKAIFDAGTKQFLRYAD